MSAAPAQITTTRYATARTAHSGTAHPESTQPDVSQGPSAADGRPREAALGRPHTVANPRRIRVR